RKIERAQSGVAKRESRHRRATEGEGRARSLSDRARARATSGRVGEGERDSVWKNSGVGKKTGRAHREICENQETFASRRSDRGRHRRSRFELDAHTGVTTAGRRAREAR